MVKPFVCIGFLLGSMIMSRAQTVRIAVLGSSTAYGMGTSDYSGVSTPPNSWVGRLQAAFRRNLNDGLDTVVDNLALPGFTTYQTRETGFVPPANMPSPDPDRNVTKALSLNPDLVLINLPSNDVNSGYPTSVTMDNYRAMVAILKNAGKKFFVLSTAPRDDAWWGPERRQQLHDQTDSIMLNFPLRSIRIWEDLATTDYFRKPEVKSLLDDVHFNDLGHSLIFNDVMAANIFGVNTILPMEWLSFTASPGVNGIQLHWQTANESGNSHFMVERSADGLAFTAIGQVESEGNGSSVRSCHYTDMKPLEGLNYYRLILVDRDRNKSYSKTITARLAQTKKAGPLLYPVPASTTLNIRWDCPTDQPVHVTITDIQGVDRGSFTFSALQGSNLFTLPVQSLPRGEYWVRISQASVTTEHYFSRL